MVLNLEEIIIPRNVTYIGEDSFMVNDIILCIYQDSYALTYAQENDINYKIINE